MWTMWAWQWSQRAVCCTQWQTIRAPCEQLSASQVEARVAALIRVSGVAILRDPSAARAACATDEGVPRTASGAMPRFVMRWQAGTCPPAPGAGGQAGLGELSAGRGGKLPCAGSKGSFTAYRVAVLLY